MDGSPANDIGVRRLWAKEILDRRLRFQRVLITADIINDLLRDDGITGELDFLIIDIDGNDYQSGGRSKPFGRVSSASSTRPSFRLR